MFLLTKNGLWLILSAIVFCSVIALLLHFYAIPVAVGVSSLFGWLKTKQENGTKIVAMVLRERDKELDGYVRVVKKYTTSYYYNLLLEMENRNSRSIFIGGIAGVGKTTLLEWLVWQHTDLQEFAKYGNPEDKPRVIVFSPKTIPHHITPDFAWLPRVDISKKIPNPFLDYQALESAITVCFIEEIRSKGVVAVSIKPLVGEIMKTSPKNWGDVYDAIKQLKKKSNTDEWALQIIGNIVRAVERPINNETVNFDSDVVLDFGNFGNNKILKSFYMELYAHAIFAQQYKENAKPTLITIDEAHYLLKYAEQGSIIGTVMREGRIGVRAVYMASQHLTDISEDLRQVGAEFMFHTGNPSDFEAVRTANPMMADALRLLAVREEFIDLKQEHEKNDSVYIYRLDDEKFERFRDIPFVRMEEPVQEATPPVDTVKEVDYVREILEVLEKSEVAMTKSDCAKKCNVPDNHKVLHALRKLLDSSSVGVDDILLRKKEVHYYYTPKLEQVHNLLLAKTKERIAMAEWKIISENRHGIQGSDFEIELNGIQLIVEVETGHKKSLGEFDKKVSEYDKHVLIIVPNAKQKERYSYLPCVNSGKVEVLLIPEIEARLKNWN